MNLKLLFLQGGRGSGNFGHKGRPGQVGGSQNRFSNNETLNDFENRVRKAKTEEAAVYDKNGKLIFSKVGDERSVSFTDDEIKMMKDTIYSHNHPNNSWFSIQDIYFAVEHDLLEMRVAFEGGAYVLERPIDGWPSMDELEKSYEGAIEEANRQLKKSILVDREFIPLKTASDLKLSYYFKRRGPR